MTIDKVFATYHYEQADRYGLGQRIGGIVGLGCKPEDFAEAFAGNESARLSMLADFTACAQPLIEAGCDVLVPAECCRDCCSAPSTICESPMHLSSIAQRSR